MAIQQVRFRYPYYVCSVAPGVPEPLLVSLGPMAKGLPFFFSEDDASLFIGRTITDGDLLALDSPADVVEFLEGFQHVPPNWVFQVMMNPVDLTGGEIRIDVAELVRQLKAQLP